MAGHTDGPLALVGLLSVESWGKYELGMNGNTYKVLDSQLYRCPSSSNDSLRFLYDSFTATAAAKAPAFLRRCLQRAVDNVAMAAMIESYVDKVVQIVTNDGRNIVGVLKGFDQTTNVILEDCNERVFSSTAGVEQVALGLYIVRGDNMCAALAVTSMSMPLPVPKT